MTNLEKFEQLASVLHDRFSCSKNPMCYQCKIFDISMKQNQPPLMCSEVCKSTANELKSLIDACLADGGVCFGEDIYEH